MTASSLARALMAVPVFLWTATAVADPSVELRAMLGPQGEQVRSSTNFMRMTENGRFILFTNAFGAPGNPQYLHMTDLKSGQTVRVSDRTVASAGAYGATADGQYVAYHADLPGGGSALEVKDMSTGIVRPVATVRGPGRVALARSGAIVYVNGNSIVLDDFFAPAPRVLSTGVGDRVRVGGMSEDGTKIVFTARDSTVSEPVNDPADRIRFFQAYLYDVPTRTRTALSINEQDGSLRHMHTLNVAINAQGTHVAILYESPHHTVSTFDVLNLETGARTLLYEAAYGVHHPLGSDEHYGGVDISRDGRFLSFAALLEPSHPEYAAVQNGVYDRIFRLEVATGALLTLSRTHDGSTPSNFVNTGTYLSSDGRHVGFAAAAKNLVPRLPISAEEPYHATIGDHVANYAFVGMPNSDQSWSHYSSMELVGDHRWEGLLRFDGNGDDAFKLDVGGSFNGGRYTPTANWSQNYGDDDADGRADWYGANIRVRTGAGLYRITFDDETKAYTVSKVVSPGSSVRVTFRCDGGTTYLGQSVYIVGSSPELGSWNPARAVKLQPTAYPTWTGDIALPATSAVTWKCLKRDEQNPAAGLVWEPGADNALDPRISTQALGAF